MNDGKGGRGMDGGGMCCHKWVPVGWGPERSPKLFFHRQLNHIPLLFLILRKHFTTGVEHKYLITFVPSYHQKISGNISLLCSLTNRHRVTQVPLDFQLKKLLFVRCTCHCRTSSEVVRQDETLSPSPSGSLSRRSSMAKSPMSKQVRMVKAAPDSTHAGKGTFL